MIHNYLTLMFLPGIGCKTAHQMLNHFGSADYILKISEKDCLEAGISPSICAHWEEKKERARKRAEKEILLCRKMNIGLIAIEDESYPHALRMCHDAPILLYYAGTPIFNRRRGVSIVGTRRASTYGKEQTRLMIEYLRGSNTYTISGLALGIDTQVHESSLENQIPTVAVVSHGLEKIYPEENLDLARRIVGQGGCILSETPLYTGLKPGMFPRRNRIIAGLGEVCVIAEAAMKGGAMLTAAWAENYQRCILAVPGRNDQYYYQGCNSLIKKGQALLLENGNDIRRELGIPLLIQQPSPGIREETYDENMMIILKVFQKENPISCERIQQECGIPWSEVLDSLLKLEMLQQVRSIPGNLYEKISGTV